MIDRFENVSGNFVLEIRVNLEEVTRHFFNVDTIYVL